ncbi:MAG: C2H2-type zinc finger protein [Thaumarchaeota archaeon]|nr:C2H2-type zinc finger protein [Nitrososphaerota archaeon]MDE1867153.1 C2H2-type zinc finger protein [Nitrososphaerota archaeon]
MITVNCRDIPSIKSPLAVYTSDQLGAVPALKLHEFVLAPIEDEEIDPANVITAIKMFLASIGCERHFAVIQKNDTISVVSLDGYKIESPTQGKTDQFFSCIHCGHVTQFETVHNNHMKIHYL